jgi:hypothetical protein
VITKISAQAAAAVLRLSARLTHVTRPIISGALRQGTRAITEVTHRARAVDVDVIVEAVFFFAVKAHRDARGGVGALEGATARVGADPACL